MKLVAEGLACERNGRSVFSDLNFVVASGSLAQLRGPNGAGKSSLLRMMAGLVPVASGAVMLDGQSDMARQSHLIAHQDALKANMTVAENLAFWCVVLGGGGVAAALNAFGMEALRDERVQLLSAGQRRRLSLSRLFLVKRPLWLLDEPTTALDATSQQALVKHMWEHLGDGGLIVAATHGPLGLASTQLIELGQS